MTNMPDSTQNVKGHITNDGDDNNVIKIERYATSGDAFTASKRDESGCVSLKADVVVAPSPLQSTVDFWLSRELPQSIPLLSPWLSPGAHYLVWGERGSGKSQIFLMTAIAAACGKACGKWKAARPVKVVYCDLEMPRTDLKKRVTEFVTAIGNPGENLLVLSTVDFPQFQSLDTEAGLRATLAMLDESKAEAFVIDNIQAGVSRSIKSGDAFDGLSPAAQGIHQRSIASVWGHHCGFSGEHHYGDSRFDWRMSGSLKTERLPSPAGEVKVAVSIDKPFRELRGSEADDIPQTVIFRGDKIQYLCTPKETFREGMAKAGNIADDVEQAIMSGQQKSLAALKKALAANGVQDADKGKMVSTDTWKEWCEIDGVNSNSFRKFKERLIAKNLVIVDGNFASLNRG